jgi:GNAT superfamily N-acetyltransferase
MEIRVGGFDRIADYAAIPIAFETSSRIDLDALRAGQLVEIPMPARRKEYDEFAEERSTALPTRFDVGNWGVLFAFDGGARVGGAIVAWDCPGFHMLESRLDLAVLADIRVAPEARGCGVGRALVSSAEGWARERGCVELKVETQDINVHACRFYQAMGFALSEIDPNAYGPDLDEVQLIWRKPL